MSQALGICLRLLENTRSSDSVRNTAAATFRQAVALIFDRVVLAESLPADKYGGQISRTTSVTSDISRSINLSDLLDHETVSGGPPLMRETLTETGKLGLRLLEDLTSMAAGGSVCFMPPVCSLLMTSLRTNVELDGEAGEPGFRRLVLRSVAHIIRLYSSSLVTECEVSFLYSNEDGWNMTRSEVSKISIRILMTRCEYILSRFLMDENESGERPLPKARLEEITYVLQELARLVVHPDTASILPLHPHLRSGLAKDKEKHDKRPHLLVLFPSFCDLVTSRELRIRELIQLLLQLVAKELSLEKQSLVS
ncbi:hypothetical protein L6164_035121 [Bauhinia variegata]|uniref:Uncharacterized protein n=1 Tax=Bauhinia variegata TaxID=167791 RepID=A0ACB9KX94_BAUVA|nr:hypothetical protein L6164_035121 [Bauhinia variegata]